MNGKLIETTLKTLYPLDLAYDWDNVGLQIGSFDKEVSNLLLTLDVTIDVVEEAIGNNCQLIIAHHPLIFSPIKEITNHTPVGKIITKLIQNDISLYVMHTNFDIAEGGLNNILCDLLGLSKSEVLSYTTETEGLGRFAHIDPINVMDYIAKIKEVFNLPHVKYIGDETAVISKVAITGGSGSSNISACIEHNIDLYITGDITYHHALDSLAKGLNIVDVGHNIEKHGIYALKPILKENGVTSQIYISNSNTDPYKTI